MSVKWIITDLDGCVSPEESVPWALEPFVEFARQSRAASAGESDLAPLTLCTGRPQPYAEVLMKILDIRAPAICENGAVLYSLPDNRARIGPGLFAIRDSHPVCKKSVTRTAVNTCRECLIGDLQSPKLERMAPAGIVSASVKILNRALGDWRQRGSQQEATGDCGHLQIGLLAASP